jgi:glucosamine--fructose-6-phosphate aminotransferase (isomerizing)
MIFESIGIFGSINTLLVMLFYMCGIFGYVGPRTDAAKLVINGLKELEYRGYDSWGVATQRSDSLDITKSIGKISEVNSEAMDNPSSLAIGHSRWATHGGVTDENAHPHFSHDKTLALVHNGIIENYQELKDRLKGYGMEFRSETDTEVIPHLIEYYMQDQDFESAVFCALRELEGRYSICVIHKTEQKIIAARRGSPLIIGLGENEYFLASDIPAFLEHTRYVNYLDDEELVIITPEGLNYFDIKTKRPHQKRAVQITWEAKEAKKGEYEHFMIKEIMEQKETIARAINQDESDIEQVTQAIKKAFGTYFVGCGTAAKVCMAASYAFAHIAKRHVNFAFGSEYPCLQDFIRKESLMIAVSQSGETADTLEAIATAKSKGAKVLSIINVEGSTMDRESDYTLFIKAGPEKSVASTKATTAQLALLILIAYSCDGRLQEGKRLLINTSSQINDMLNPRYEDHIRSIAEKIHHFESMYVIGKGINYPVALEAAIKLQEVSYIHAEGFASGELKHGPLALITEGTPLITFIPNDETEKDILNNTMEVKARGGYIIGISPKHHEVFDEWIKVPDAKEASPIVNIIAVQVLAYHLALLKDNNPDMPRNLAKSVTVK